MSQDKTPVLVTTEDGLRATIMMTPEEKEAYLKLINEGMEELDAALKVTKPIQ